MTMIQPRRTLLGVAVVCVVIAGCGSSDSSVESEVPTASETPTASDPSTPELANAEDVRSEELVGDPVPMGSEATDGHVVAVVSNPVVGGDDGGPWLEIDLRIENATDEDVQYFNSGIVCSGNDEMGGTVQGGTVDSSAGIPAGTFEEGSQFMLLPGDGRYGEPITPCETPAVLRIEVIGEDGFVPDEALTWAIPDDVIDQINAAIP